MKNWILLLGVALIVYGGFRLATGMMGPDAIASAGPNNTLISGILIVIGAIAVGASRLIKETKK